MKERNEIVTLQEAEQLCQHYMECKLSVLEETELRYFLSKVDYHTTLIDEVRRIMDIEALIATQPKTKENGIKERNIRKWRLPVSIAASIAVMIGICLTFIHFSSTERADSSSYYIAYINGKRISDEQAKLHIEAQKKNVDDFIREMEEIEEMEQQTINNFFNL